MSGAEEWRPVFGWEGVYDVSSFGRVRSLPRIVEVSAGGRKGRHLKPVSGRILALARDTFGYPLVCLMRDGKQYNRTVHRLVCEAFHGPRPPGHFAAHNDGSADNNRPDNLRWALPVENTADRRLHGTMVEGEDHPNALLTEQDVVRIRRLLKSRGPTEIGKMFGVTKHCIFDIKRGRSWKHVPG
jgi:hypothetical protein